MAGSLRWLAADPLILRPRRKHKPRQQRTLHRTQRSQVRNMQLHDG